MSDDHNVQKNSQSIGIRRCSPFCLIDSNAFLLFVANFYFSVSVHAITIIITINIVGAIKRNFHFVCMYIICINMFVIV